MNKDNFEFDFLEIDVKVISHIRIECGSCYYLLCNICILLYYVDMINLGLLIILNIYSIFQVFEFNTFNL